MDPMPTPLEEEPEIYDTPRYCQAAACRHVKEDHGVSVWMGEPKWRNGPCNTAGCDCSQFWVFPETF